MQNIKDIMKILKCDQKHAFAVFGEMQLDFSGCTKTEFKRETLAANARLAAR
jgi:hypothetical protein